MTTKKGRYNERIEIIKSLTEPFMKSILYPPANEKEISDFEKSNDIIIPKSYKEFLMLTNGAILFGGDAFLYGISGEVKYHINHDFTGGQIPKQFLILGYYRDRHICYDYRDEFFVFYREGEYEHIKEECMIFNIFCEVLDYMIDIAIN